MKKLIPLLFLPLVALVVQAGPPVNWSATGGAFYPSVGQVQMPGGTVTAPGTTTSGSLGSGLWWPAADTLALSTAGVERWRTDASGLTGFNSTTNVAQVTIRNTSSANTGGLRLDPNPVTADHWDFWPGESGQRVLTIANNSAGAFFVMSAFGSLTSSAQGILGVAGLETQGLDASVDPTTLTLSASGAAHQNLIYANNPFSIVNNYGGIIFGGTSHATVYSSGIFGVNEVHGANPTGHLTFVVNSAGTLAETVRMLANKTLQFFGYGAGILHTSASGVVSASTIVDADVNAAAGIQLSKLGAITGYVSGAGTVSATDTIVQAIGKLNGNAAGGGGGSGIIFQQSGGLSIMDDFGNPAPITAAVNISSVTVAMCATGTTGKVTTFSIKQYTGTVLDNTVTGSITGTGNNCAISTSGVYQGTVALSGTLTVAAGDTLVANLTAIATGAQDITISASTASNVSTFTNTAIPFANLAGILTQDVSSLSWTAGSSVLNASVVATGGGSFATNAGIVVKNGHVKSSQTTAPTAAVQAGAGGGGTCVLTNATDTAGTVTLTAGTITLASGAECIVTFNKAYNVAPLCVMWPVNSATALAIATIGEYNTSNTTTMSVNFGAAPVTTVVYAWNYHCIETQ